MNIFSFRRSARQVYRSRVLRGFRYALGRTTEDDAFTLLSEAERLVGCYSLETISTTDVIDYARESFVEGPELEIAADAAARRVSHKWDSFSDLRSTATDWAMDLVNEWADDYGLKRLPEVAEQEEAS